MIPRLVVGNDVVDLAAPHVAGRAADARLLARVLAPDEARSVAADPDPDTAFWAHWACKEAAFKVVSKLAGRPPPFAHRSFHVRIGPEEPAKRIRTARVRWEGHELPAAVVRLPGGALHALARHRPRSGRPWVSVVSAVELLDRPGGSWSAPLPDLEARLSEAETRSVHSRASAAVRLGARAALAAALGVAERRLEIVCGPGPVGRTPPRALLDGAGAPADVSLSHHGRWLAWALAVPADPGERSVSG